MDILPPPFPEPGPADYTADEDGIEYDADYHLQLEYPDRVWYLHEFGYSAEEIEQCASEVAVTSPFRLLSRAGVAALYAVADRLRTASTHLEGNRTPSHLAGGVYRSRFLQDMCACPKILGHMSEIAGTDLLPHSMPSQQVYINYTPDDISKAVDAWHYDGIGFDYVIMVTDPADLKGGDFEYFRGTRQEIAEMAGIEMHQIRYGVTRELPESRVYRTRFPNAGYSIFQQGNMVVHRATRLLEPADRITAVPGLVSSRCMAVDPTAKHDMPNYNEPGIIAELARHSAWVSQNKLAKLIHELPLSDDRQAVSRALSEAVADVNSVIAHLDPESSSSKGK